MSNEPRSVEVVTVQRLRASRHDRISGSAVIPGYVPGYLRSVPERSLMWAETASGGAATAGMEVLNCRMRRGRSPVGARDVVSLVPLSACPLGALYSSGLVKYALRPSNSRPCLRSRRRRRRRPRPRPLLLLPLPQRLAPSPFRVTSRQSCSSHIGVAPNLISLCLGHRHHTRGGQWPPHRVFFRIQEERSSSVSARFSGGRGCCISQIGAYYASHLLGPSFTLL